VQGPISSSSFAREELPAKTIKIRKRRRLFWKPGETVDILDLKIRKAVHNLNFEIREAIDDLPLPGTVGKGTHSLDMEIGEGINDLHFVVRKAAHELDFPVDLGHLGPTRCGDGNRYEKQCEEKKRGSLFHAQTTKQHINPFKYLV
jgi:hypothetical protein